jgi:diguanylate cyclase (GGDEF)-like protein
MPQGRRRSRVRRKTPRGQRSPGGPADTAETDLDALTDLRSRRAYDREAEELLEAARATGSPLAILVIDVNQFKQINDTRGHSAGDAALCAIANEATKTAHGRGRGYRYGGDETVVLMPNASAREAYASAERLANAVRTLSVPEVGWPLSLSIGVAAFPEQGDSLEALFNAADRAMYQAKHTEGAPVQIAPSDTRQGAIEISSVPLASAGPTNEIILEGVAVQCSRSDLCCSRRSDSSKGCRATVAHE